MAEYHSTATLEDAHAKIVATDGGPIAAPTSCIVATDGEPIADPTSCKHMHDPREPHLALPPHQGWSSL
jgi:hypothetical protein